MTLFLVTARACENLNLGAEGRAPIAGRKTRRSGAVVVFVPALIANQARYDFFIPRRELPAAGA